MTRPPRLLRLGVWRHCRIERRRFPFWEMWSEHDLFELTQAVLKEDGDLAELIDELADRPRGFFTAVTLRSTSHARRQMAYAADILASLTLKHDIGRKGGLAYVLPPRHAPAPRGTGTGALWGAVIEGLRTAGPAGLTVRVDGGVAWSRPAEEGKGRGFTIAASSDPGITVEAPAWRACEAVLEEVVGHVAGLCSRAGLAAPAVVPVVADLLLTDGGPVLLEVHLPGRGAGVHLAPLAFMPGRASAERRVVEGWVAVAGEPEPSPGELGPDEQFRALDRLFWVAAARDGSARLVTDESSLLLPLAGVVAQVADRSSWAPVAPVVTGPRHVRIDDLAALDRSAARFAADHGPWAVLKPERNAPWWSKAPAQRTRFVHVRSARGRRAVAAMLAHGPVRLEELVLARTDRFGRSGELRLHALVDLRAGGAGRAG